MVEWVWYTSIGLFLDMLGIIIMISPYFREIRSVISRGSISAVLRREVSAETIRTRLIIGLIFLLVGFALQIMGAWTQFCITSNC